jgi:AT-rich interactive domain-containing protein 1
MSKNLFYKQKKVDSKRKRKRPLDDEEKERNDDELVSWWENIQIIRENTLVTVANLAGALQLNSLDPDVIELFSHGLVHWSICKSSDAQDPLTTHATEISLLSPQRLAIEALSKMTINDTNVDLVLSTIRSLRPYLDELVSCCSTFLAKRDDQTMREFSIVLLTAIAKSDQLAARVIGKHVNCFITFIEDYEEQARRIKMTSDPSLRDANCPLITEENLGTTIDMLKRAANCIKYIAIDIDNLQYISRHEQRLLNLITSQFIDKKVGQILSEVLYYCSPFVINQQHQQQSNLNARRSLTL